MQTKEERTKKHRECQRLYKQSKKGKEVEKKYRQSIKGKEASKRYYLKCKENPGIKEKHSSYQTKWNEEHWDQWYEYHKRWYKNAIKKYPERFRARNQVAREVRKGTMVKPKTCSICNNAFPKEKIQGHHKDYLKPLVVVWCCRECHKKIEKQ